MAEPKPKSGAATAPTAKPVWHCHCPLKCKGNKALGSFMEYEDAVGKVLHHLMASSLHSLNEDEAGDMLRKYHAIWKDDDEYFIHDERQRSYSPPPRKLAIEYKEKSKGRSSSHRRSRTRSRSQGRGSSSSAAHRPSSARALSEQAMSETTSHLLANVQEQKDKVFAFARTLGKCEAVIKTAARVAREAALAFEASCLNSHSKQSTSTSHS